MYAMSATKQYQSVNLQSEVFDASPHRLIQMLLDGGLSRLAQARGALERNDLSLKGELIGKAIGIVAGLREALDFEQGGEIAANLDRLYDYMMVRLSEANRHNDASILVEVADLLREVKSAWDAIGTA